MPAALPEPRSGPTAVPEDDHVFIGLPVYNGGDYLEEAVRSLLGQTHQNLTVHISDNCSTDTTEEIARAFVESDERVTYHRNAENLGATGNWDRVREVARGPYFKWAAHDDVHGPRWVELCLDALRNEPGAALAYTGAVVIDQHSDVLDVSIDEGIDGTIVDHRLRFRDFLLNEIWCIPIFGLTRLDLVAPMPPIGKYYGSDKAVLAELALKGTFVKIDEPLFLRRFHPTNSSQLEGKAARAFQAGGGGLSIPPQLRIFGGYTSAVVRSELSPVDKLKAMGAIVEMVTDRERSAWREEHRVRLNQIGSS